jgi:hypothetical protein
MKAGLGTRVDVGPDSQSESGRTLFVARSLEEVARLFRWGAAERSRGAALSAETFGYTSKPCGPEPDDGLNQEMRTNY